MTTKSVNLQLLAQDLPVGKLLLSTDEHLEDGYATFVDHLTALYEARGVTVGQLAAHFLINSSRLTRDGVTEDYRAFDPDSGDRIGESANLVKAGTDPNEVHLDLVAGNVLGYMNVALEDWRKHNVRDREEGDGL